MVTKKKKKPVVNKEEDSENWCFICKDGGELRICDQRECLKSYHPSCLEKDESFLESDKYWACAWHTCFNCCRRAYLQCYTCPRAVCRYCLNVGDLHRVKGQYGFCDRCRHMALLIEERKEYDSDGDRVDFRDRETYEGLFMEYYIIVKEKEGFELRDLRAAKSLSKKESESISEDIDEEDQAPDSDSDQISDYDGVDHVRKHRRTCNRKGSARKKSEMGTPMKSNKLEFVGWGSRSLIEFLSSIGKSTDEKLSQRNVTTIVNEYINKNNLLHPDKRKMVICDRLLESLFKKKSFSKHRVHGLLEAHFAENYDESEEDEVGYDSDDDDAGIPDVQKSKRKLDMESSLQKELADTVPLGLFASIVVENIKLVYLQRSMILEMLKQPETFEEKVVGCFVRVKSDQHDYCSRNSHQLMKVRGVRRIFNDENTMEVILLFSAPPKEMSVRLLSDDNFTKEECEELKGKISGGQLERPTVEDLQQKANILHVDLTKHRISKELALLPNLIDRANDKGWRRELFMYLERKKTLQDPLEVSKLLQNVPRVIPDPHVFDPSDEDIVNDIRSDKDSPSDECPDNNSSEEKTHHGNNSSAPERKQPNTEVENVRSRKLSKCDAEFINNQEQKTVSSHAVTKLLIDDETLNGDQIWCLKSPYGEVKKFSLSLLKRWNEINVNSSKFKVWKEDENEDDAVWLHEILKK